MKKVVAIIPARAGSKRIPRKNIVDLKGKPMIAWTIEAALRSEVFSDVIVSTDGEEIASIAQKWGAEVPFLRDPKDADDFIPTYQAVYNALLQLERYKSTSYDIVVQLMANCPCRTYLTIRNAYQHFLETDAEFQISVFKFGWMNPWWAMKSSPSMQPVPLFPEALKKRSQDLEELFCPTGAIWMAKVDAFKRDKTFYGDHYKIYPIDWKDAVDIDTLEDFEMAKAVMELQPNLFCK